MTDQERLMFRQIYELRKKTFVSPEERDRWSFAWQITRVALREVGYDVKDLSELGQFLPDQLTCSAINIYEADEVAVLGRANILIAGLCARVSQLQVDNNLAMPFGGILESSWHTVNNQLANWRKNLITQASVGAVSFTIGDDPKVNSVLVETCLGLESHGSDSLSQNDHWTHVLYQVESTKQWLSELLGEVENLQVNLNALSEKFRRFILFTAFQNASPNQVSDGVIIPSTLRALTLQ